MHYSTSDNPTSTIERSLTCPRCGTIDTPTVGPGKGPHAARALCRNCGTHIQWISQYSPEEQHRRRQAARAEAMAHKPASVLQISYLTALGYAGPPPANMLEASKLIDTFIQKRGDS